jgi:hypothetical protein
VNTQQTYKKEVRKLDTSWIIDFVKDYNLVVLRDKKTNRAYNVSFTNRGLHYTTYSSDFIYFINPKIIRTDDFFYINGEINSKYEILKFIPMDHYNKDGSINLSNQIAEYKMVDKALRLLNLSSDKTVI